MAVFAAELILLLLIGRMLGEGMSRLGQPAIFEQLLAGVVLGPSVFGALLPEIRHLIFPDTPVLKSMIDAISQIGILLLLLLTGMETNLALVKRRRGTVISTSLLGIAAPFACGVGLAYALPEALMPNPAAELVTALFLGTALSISSVKIVAMVLMEVGAIRRDLGQPRNRDSRRYDRLGHGRGHRRHGCARRGELRQRRSERGGNADLPRAQPNYGPRPGCAPHPLVQRPHDDRATSHHRDPP
jgi:Sodium/hydrogen exchanger family